MIRIFTDNEMPVKYINEIKANNINIFDVKYVVESSIDNGQTWRIAEKLGKYQQLGNYKDGYFYIIFEE